MALVLGTDWIVKDGAPPTASGFGYSPGSARIRYYPSGSVAFHIADQSYPGQYNLYFGPLRKSTDLGVSWVELTPPVAGYNCAAFDRSLVDNRLWTAWIQFPFGIMGWWFVYYSDNDGTTWTLSLAGMQERNIQDIFCHPTNANIAAICCTHTIYFGEAGTRVTTDHGTTWAASIAFSASLGSSVAGATNSNPPLMGVWTSTGAMLVMDINNGIYRSTDNGANWTIVKASTSATTSNSGALIRPTAANLYFAYRAVGLGAQTPLYRSTDHGATWTSLALPAGQDDVRGLTYDVDTDVLAIVTDISSAGGGAGQFDQVFWLAAAGSVGSGSEVWTEIANAPYELFGDHPYYSVTRWTYDALCVMGTALYTVTNYDYEQLGTGASGGPGGGGGGGPQLESPFSRAILDRFQREVIVDRRPERFRP